MKTYHFKIKISVDGRERWADGDKLFAHLMKDYNKTLLKGKENMDKRLKKFKLDVLQSDCSEKYDYKLLEEFIEYWTEPNKSDTKMRFELEKTWSLSRRLKTWKRNGFGKDLVEDGRTKHEKYVHPVINDEDVATPEEIREILGRE
tara:strand:- start:519 stop:956 length:438 start_codon:yes stop_codon:yes gene_type:complete